MGEDLERMIEAAGVRTKKKVQREPSSVGKSSAQPWQRERKKVLEASRREELALDRACRGGGRSACRSSCRRGSRQRLQGQGP